MIQGLARYADIDHSRPQCPAAPKCSGISLVDDIELVRACGTHSPCEDSAVALELVELESAMLSQDNTAVKRSTSKLDERTPQPGRAAPSSSKSVVRNDLVRVDGGRYRVWSVSVMARWGIIVGLDRRIRTSFLRFSDLRSASCDTNMLLGRRSKMPRPACMASPQFRKARLRPSVMARWLARRLALP